MGDAVLSFVVSEYVYEENKTKKEGFLSKKRAVIVARKHLNMIAKKIISKEQLKTKTRSKKKSTCSKKISSNKEPNVLK